MSAFGTSLRERAGALGGPRRWVFIPYDQLHDAIGPLSQEAPEALGVVLIESRAKATKRRYHKQKLALVLTNMRHFALEQAERGVAVRYVDAGDDDYATTLRALHAELGSMRVMRPAERELRVELQPLFGDGTLEEIPHDGWLTTSEDFGAIKGPPWRMDSFYRQVRKRTGVLMESGKPVGGKYSFDADNRERWDGDPPAPPLPTFEVDAVTEEVCALVERAFADHPGALRPEHLPATRADAEVGAWVRGELAAGRTLAPDAG